MNADTILWAGAVASVAIFWTCTWLTSRPRLPRPEPQRDRYGCLPNEFPTLDQIWSSVLRDRAAHQRAEDAKRERAGRGGYRT